MFKFTIRELLLLTVIVGMGVAWWVDRQRNAKATAALRGDLTAKFEAMELQKKGWHTNANFLAEYLRRRGFEVTLRVDEGGRYLQVRGSGAAAKLLPDPSAHAPNLPSD